MDGRGCLAEPVTRPDRPRAGVPAPRPLGLADRPFRAVLAKIASRISSFMRFCVLRLEGARIPRFTGMAAAALFLGATIGYGAVRGDHVPMIVETLKDWRDAGANS